MFEQLLNYVSQYGYLSIFLLVFLQEIGVPNPFPNEIVLLFAGYLSFTGVLNGVITIICAISGDLLGSGILFVTFYFFGNIIIKNKPPWIPLSNTKLESLSEKIRQKGQSSIFIGRLTPFIKGYVSVLSGLTRYSPSKYGITLLSTSIIWATIYVCTGYVAGPYWNLIEQNSSRANQTVLVIAVTIIIIIMLLQAFRKSILKIK